MECCLWVCLDRLCKCMTESTLSWKGIWGQFLFMHLCIWWFSVSCTRLPLLLNLNGDSIDFFPSRYFFVTQMYAGLLSVKEPIRQESLYKKTNAVTQIQCCKKKSLLSKCKNIMVNYAFDKSKCHAYDNSKYNDNNIIIMMIKVNGRNVIFVFI